MDSLDMRILGRLLNNCREPDRQVGRHLGVSGGAVRARTKRMQGAGIIERFALQVEPPLLGRGLFYVVVTGRDTEEVTAQAKLVGEPYLVAPCVGGVTVCGIVTEDGVPRGIELARNLMKDARVLSIFEAGDPGDGTRLTRTDLAVMRELAADPRRRIDAAAGAAGLSAKTVARSIEKMQGSGAVRFTLTYDPTRMAGYIPYVVLTWAGGGAAAMAGRLEAEFGGSFMQAPFVARSQVVLFMYSDDIFKMDDMVQRVRDVPGVGSADLFIPRRITLPQKWMLDAIEDACRSPTLHLARRGAAG